MAGLGQIGGVEMTLRPSYRAALTILALGVLWLASGALSGPDEGARDHSVAETYLAAAKPVTVRVRDSAAMPVTAEVVVTGSTHPSRMVRLKAETMGRVTETVAQEGAVLGLDSVIASLAANDRAERVAQAQALVAQRTLEYEAASKLSKQAFTSQVRLAQAKADLAAAKAMAKAAKLDREHATLRAPFDGVLETRLVEVGDHLSVGDDYAVFVDLDPLDVVVQVSEAELEGLTADAVGHVEAPITLADGRVMMGRVTHIGRVAAEATRTFRIELQVPNADLSIPAGMTAEVRLPKHTVPAHAVSQAALTLSRDGAIGMKYVDDQSLVHFAEVSLVRSDGDTLWVAGLPERARIIVQGQELVTEGQAVATVAEQDVAERSRDVQEDLGREMLDATSAMP